MGIFGNNFNFEQPSTNDKKEFNENYLMGILDMKEQAVFYVLSTSRSDFAHLLLSLSTKRYAIAGVQLLQHVKNYTTLLKQLKDQDKPEDMNFGGNKGKED